jgi:hypothetical protein
MLRLVWPVQLPPASTPSARERGPTGLGLGPRHVLTATRAVNRPQQALTDPLHCQPLQREETPVSHGGVVHPSSGLLE